MEKIVTILNKQNKTKQEQKQQILSNRIIIFPLSPCFKKNAHLFWGSGLVGDRASLALLQRMHLK